MSEPLLRAEGVRVRRSRREVLDLADVHIQTGEVVAVYGPNGAGKSTLLLALAALLPLASGRLFLRGREVGRGLSALEYRRKTAVVFQEPLLLRGTVWHNVTLGMRLRGVPRPEQERRGRGWLDRLQIAHLAHRPAATLSGGEAQRANLARALVLEPDVLFLDEPFPALDTPTRSRLVAEVGDILAGSRIATLLVTHDLPEAMALSHRCLVLDNGRVLQQGPLPDLLRQPCSRRVADILGRPFPGVTT